MNTAGVEPVAESMKSPVGKKADKDNGQAILLGYVDGFTMDSVYIDGKDYMMAKYIEFYSSKGTPVTKEKIKKGLKVKYVLNPSNEVEIIQLAITNDDEYF
jgi:hypothetical protein